MFNRSNEFPDIEHFFEAESLNEVKRLECLPSNRGKGEYFGKSEDAISRWAGGPANLAAWHKFIRDGYPDGVERVKKMTQSVESPLPRDIRRKAKWDDSGDEIEMERVYIGNVDKAWRRVLPRDLIGPTVVKIWCAVVASCAEDANNFFWPGAATLTMADLLENAGYRVEIVAYCQGQANGNAVMTMPVKLPDDPMNLDRLAAVICNAATMRVGMHAMEYAHIENAPSGGYSIMRDGSPSHINSLRRNGKPSPIEDHDIHIECWSERAAKECVKNEMARFSETSKAWQD